MIPRRAFLRPVIRPPLTGRLPLKVNTRSAPFSVWNNITVSDQKSGHIRAGDEPILFFDNLFPLKLGTLLRKVGFWQTDQDLPKLLKKFDDSSLGVMDPISLVKRSIPESAPLKVTEIIPHLKDGGAFVKFSHAEGLTPAEIEGTLAKHLMETPIKPWFNPFRGVKIGLVEGEPWLEDLHRFPKTRIKIEFIPKEPGSEAAELSQESIYGLFRKYGKIAEITPQPSDSKVMPKFAYLDFVMLRDSIIARNCLHGFVVPEGDGGGTAGTKLRLTYEQKVKPHYIWEWFTSHPRIVIPIVAALLAAITVVIFDPIREWFIKAHIQKRFKLSNSHVFQWFKRQTDDILAFRKQKGENAGLKALFTHRRDAIDSIKTWLMETADTFIVVQGPRGSGKEELVIDQALSERKDVLVINCKPITEARGESSTITKLATEVGYRPIFSWANQLSSLVDLAIQSTTGVKSGFSETLDSQINKILQNTAAALKDVSLADRKKEDGDENTTDDAFLEAHPERRAVVVIENFLLKNEESSIIYDKIAEWAAALVQSNIAHVIFLTSDTSYSKPLSKSMPDRVFRTIALGDLSPDVAKKYVLSHLTETHFAKSKEERKEDSSINEKQQAHELQQSHELDEVIEVLGGRLTDLEFLARRLKTGQSPKEAVGEIIEQSASEILKLFLLPGKGNGKKYSKEQAWFLVKEIAKKESLRYHEVLLSNTFALSTTEGAADGEMALENLTNSELITVKSYKGRPQSIQAGKPVYQAAFNSLVHDPVLTAKMDLAILTELAKIEAKTIDKVENELSLLGSLPRQPYETTARINYLLSKLQTSQGKIASFEKEMGSLKKTLSQEI